MFFTCAAVESSTLPNPISYFDFKLIREIELMWLASIYALTCLYNHSSKKTYFLIKLLFVKIF